MLRKGTALVTTVCPRHHIRHVGCCCGCCDLQPAAQSSLEDAVSSFLSLARSLASQRLLPERRQSLGKLCGLVTTSTAMSGVPPVLRLQLCLQLLGLLPKHAVSAAPGLPHPHAMPHNNTVPVLFASKLACKLQANSNACA